ncbi:GGDEF domain-containing protein [Reinekea marinisedimentorum]|uniref:diguanylate cyclase n=1 Tax=Reinekea marinisedimentorum TaxID=230495 RepID=A0A4R3IB33_9GAMM|nr:GGDEF domain-containing protein [Reinekea marinisedimentorum]TCS43809.1 diguanylate cyclase (GGDEF)-like protein [Reinekea marinisedimentorum]
MLASFGVCSVATAQSVSLQLKWLHQFQFAGYYMAKEKGFYADVGLDVTIHERQANMSSIKPLIEGVADFSVSDPGSVIYFSRGAPIVALAAIFQHSPSILIVREDAQVTELTELKGKRLRNSQGYSNAELLAMFQKAGLSMFDVDIAASDLSLQAFVDGDLEALNGYLSNEPYMLDQLGIRYRLFKPVDYGVDFYGDILTTTPRMIEQSPQLVEDFRRASLQGWDYALANVDEAIDVILAKYNTQNKSREQLAFEAEQIVSLILPGLVPVGYMNPERWQHIVNTFQQFGSIEYPVNLNSFIYQPPAEHLSFMDFYRQNQLQFHVGVIVVIALLLLFHNLMLRKRVLKSTLELHKAKLLAEDDARTDALTRLPNRRHFFEVLNRDLEHARRNQQSLIDNFKQINDRYGHSTGDEVLQQVGQFFQREVRSGDFCARIGGEEFVMLYRDTSLEHARYITERLRQQIREERFYTANGEISITLSIGLTCLNNDESAERLMSFADAAMYQAKRTGKDRIVVMH